MGACCSQSSAADPQAVAAVAASAAAAPVTSSQPGGGALLGREAEQPAKRAGESQRQGVLTEKRMLLISDNLPFYEILVRACLDDVVVVTVQYAAWRLADLQKAIFERAGPPGGQFSSVGLLDHGESGKFCLLRELSEGGFVDLPLLLRSPELQSFFKVLAQYVRPPRDVSDFRSDIKSRIDLMACSVAAGEDGAKLIDALEELTKINWAASTDRTGCGEGVENGFDWVMETEEKLGLGSVHMDYFKEDSLRDWKHSCDPGNFSLALQAMREGHVVDMLKHGGEALQDAGILD